MATNRVSPRTSNATATTITAQVEPSQRGRPTTVGILRLRAQSVVRRSVTWAEDVIDNENMGKKKSKVCCIYHKPRPFGESSSEEDSSDSSSSESDSEPDNSRARMGGNGKGKRPVHHVHGHQEGCGQDESHPDPKESAKGKEKRKKGPNAYERLPKASTMNIQTMK